MRISVLVSIHAETLREARNSGIDGLMHQCAFYIWLGFLLSGYLSGCELKTVKRITYQLLDKDINYHMICQAFTQKLT